jgi:hypothetical protein
MCCFLLLPFYSKTKVLMGQAENELDAKGELVDEKQRKYQEN